MEKNTMDISIPWTLLKDSAVWMGTKAADFYLKNKGLTFVFEKYIKRVAIFKNGHGIVSNSFLIKSLNHEQFTSFERRLDIRDACKDVHFQKLDELIKINPCDRFNQMGFWYNDDGGFVSDIDPIIDNCEKIIKWKFCINKAKLQSSKDKKFRLSYAVSVPGLFPIRNGYFCKEIAAERNSQNTCNSAITVRHKLKDFRYIIAFEDGIHLSEGPLFKLFRHGEDNPNPIVLRSENISDIFYNRFVAHTKSPSMGAKIQVSWKLSDKNNEK